MPKFANIFLFNRLPAPGGGGTLYYGFSGSKVTNINYSPPPHGGGAGILIYLLLLTFDADFGRFLTRLIPHTRNKSFFSVYKETNVNETLPT